MKLNAKMKARVPYSIAWTGCWHADRIRASDGAQLASWPDLSGNGRHAVQPTPARRPTLVRGKFNGRATVSFGGGTDVDSRFLRADLPNTAQPWTLFVVGNFGAGNAQRMIAGLAADGTTLRNPLGVSGTGAVFANAGTNILAGTSHDTKVSTFLVQANGASGKLRVDGVDYPGQIGSLDIASLIFGAQHDGGSPLAGQIAFVGFKSGTLTGGEVAALEAWAADYYGTAAQPYPREENWSWWARPRAVAYRGKTYVLATDGQTNAVVSIYDGLSRTPQKVIVGQSGGAVDDHDNGALIIEPGREPIVLYCRHADPADPNMHWRKGTQVIEQGFGPFGAEKLRSSQAGCTYPSAHVVDGVIHVIFRDDLYWWSYMKSTDWGETFTVPQRLVYHPEQCHIASVVRNGVMRLAMGAHPANTNQSVYYAEVNLTSGDVTAPGSGTVFGNLSGTSLPITMDALPVVATAAAGLRRWVYDVSDAADPEIVWSSFNSGDLAGTGVLWYSRLVSGSWTTRQIASTGTRFSDASQVYLGAGQFPRKSSGGRVYVVRESSGTWTVERRDTADNGQTWATKVLKSSPTRHGRGWPVESRDGGAPYEVAVNMFTRFTAFTDMQSSITLVGPDPSYA